MSTPRTIQSRLDERLIRQAKRFDRLTQQLRLVLPPECDGHFHVANLRQRTLILVTDSPVWTTRLRQLGPQILDTLRQTGIDDIQHINVSSRVSRQLPPKREPVVVKRELSQRSGDIIDRTAEYISDEGLKRALKKLAKRASD